MAKVLRNCEPRLLIKTGVKRSLVFRVTRKHGSQYQSRLKKLAGLSARYQKYQPVDTNQVTRTERVGRTERGVSVITKDTLATQCVQCTQFTASYKPTGNLPERLLADILGIFIRSGADKLRVMEIIDHLCVDTSKPWATLCDGRNLSARRLNSMLVCYHISSKDFRFKDGVFKGFSKESIVEACSRISQ